MHQRCLFRQLLAFQGSCLAGMPLCCVDAEASDWPSILKKKNIVVLLVTVIWDIVLLVIAVIIDRRIKIDHVLRSWGSYRCWCCRWCTLVWCGGCGRSGWTVFNHWCIGLWIFVSGHLQSINKILHYTPGGGWPSGFKGVITLLAFFTNSLCDSSSRLTTGLRGGPDMTSSWSQMRSEILPLTVLYRETCWTVAFEASTFLLF